MGFFVIRKQAFRYLLIAVMICFVLLSLISKNAIAQINVPKDTIRVALGLDLASADFSVVLGEYELVDHFTQQVISTGILPGSGAWVIAPAGYTNMQLSNKGSSAIQGVGGTIMILRQKNSAGDNVF